MSVTWPSVVANCSAYCRQNDSCRPFVQQPFPVAVTPVALRCLSTSSGVLKVRTTNELWLLVQLVGDGTRRMAEYKPGDVVNIMLPLGNGFTLPADKEQKLLLIGGGVGTAPMLYLGSILKKAGYTPTFLLGARSKEDVLQLEQFEQFGTVYVTTEDGSLGEKGYVTNHSILKDVHFDRIYTCGPKPMMVAVAKYAHANSIICEVSLENTMACGIGACLCCVEKTKDEHHVCVCTEGPVFNIENLTWLN